MSPPHAIFFLASQWSSLISSRSLIGQYYTPSFFSLFFCLKAPLAAAAKKNDWCYYPHQSRDSLTSVCRISYLIAVDFKLKYVFKNVVCVRSTFAADF